MKGNFRLTRMFAAQLGETGGRRRRGAISSRQEQSSPLNGQETFTDAAQRQKRLNGEQYPPTHLSQNSSLEGFTAFTDFLWSFSKVHWQKAQRAELLTLCYFQTFSIKILICSFSNVRILSPSPSFEKVHYPGMLHRLETAEIILADGNLWQAFFHKFMWINELCWSELLQWWHTEVNTLDSICWSKIRWL